jgi:hypothetical protein
MLKDILVASELTEDDIAQNKADKLSWTQKGKLVGKVIEVIGTLLFLGGLVIYALSVSSWFCSLFAFIFALAGLERIVQLILIYIEAKKGRVSTVTGPIDLTPQSRSRATLRVGRQRFNINARQLLALRNGFEYTAYFTPYSRMLMSIVPAQNAAPLDAESLPAESLLYNEKSKRSEVVLGDDGELIKLQDE